MDRALLLSIIGTTGRVGLLVLFAVAVVLVARTVDPEKKRRRVIAVFAYVAVLHLLVGIPREVDAWPFTSYGLMHGRADFSWPLWRIGFFGVDSRGSEWRIDPYAWESISDWHLQWWFYKRFDRLPERDKQQALQTLFDRAEQQRSLIAGSGQFPWRSFMGPATAPQLWLLPREPSVPHEPYRKLRVYYEEWKVPERLAGKDPKRTMIREFSSR